jgi:hypothetical protein
MKTHLRPTILVFCMALSSLFSGCSLQDHPIPETLAIRTEPVEYNNGWDFAIQADKLGSLPVTEHGILFLAFFRASTDTDYVPRIEHGSRIKFDGPLILGQNKFKYTGNGFDGRYFFFYRAYAILSDGSVVYGNIVNYTF